MRVLLVGTGDRGGIGRYEHLLARALREIGEDSGLELHSVWRAPHPAYFGQVNGESRYPAGANSVPRFALRALNRMLDVKPEIIVFTTVNLARLLIGPPAAQRRSRSVICIHGKEVTRPLGPLKRAGLHRGGHVIASTPYTEAQLRSVQAVPRERVSVVPLALEPLWLRGAAATRRSAGRSDASTPRLLTVARLSSHDRYKGIDLAIRALPEIAKRVPGVTYRIVGSGDDETRLRGIAGAAGVAHRVQFLGSVDQEALLREYRDCSVFILPSKEEGFGLVFLEAMAFGKPVVASAAAGSLHVVKDGETGILVADDSQLAGAVTKLLLDRAELDRLGERGRRRLDSHFSFEAYRDRWAGVLSQMAMR